MPVTQCDLDWLAVRLLPAIHDINQHQKHKRITERLRSLLNELEPMKFQITQPTFWQGQERKPGDILEGQTGPMKYVRASNGKMEAIPLYVELPEAIIPVMPVTTITPVTLPVPSNPTPLPPAPSPITPTNEPPSMSITGLQSGAFKAMLAAMRKEIADAQAQGVADVQSMADDAKTEITTAVSGVKAKIKSEVADALQEFATSTNGGPS